MANFEPAHNESGIEFVNVGTEADRTRNLFRKSNGGAMRPFSLQTDCGAN